MRHVPVLLNEVIAALEPKSGMNFVDCTLGDGGHAEAILEKIAPSGKLLGIDADPESLLRAKQYLYRFGERAMYVRDNFVHMKKIVAENNFGHVDGILMDLGWSSPQFAERGRGFSFEKDEKLDMRYDPNCHSEGGTTEESLAHLENGQRSLIPLRMTCETAAEIVNGYSETELNHIFKTYGEEKLYKEIAEAIVATRNKEQGTNNKIETTKQLVDIILEVYRNKLNSTKEIPWIGGIHPATKVFQALRIEVNQELAVLKEVLPQLVEILSPGGRLAVITFHSLEDRTVKQFFQTIAHKQIKLINKKPLTASAKELADNSRSRSAKLRVVEKINENKN